MQNKYFYPLFLLATLLFISPAMAQKRYTVSGTVRDAATGETLIGATVRIQGAGGKSATMTNSYGFYSLTHDEGEYDLSVTYTGYQVSAQKIKLAGNLSINIDIKGGAELQEVVISATDRKNENVRSPQMGLDKLNMKDLDNIPVIFGEKDVLKTIQLLPGVKS
ncbi:MAG: carboxypeptidase-like regulatory domain-containing protein, partial [Sphingobacteriales bacterium]